MTFFRLFSDSVASTEASAELFRPKLTEASAEASVSVVRYLPVSAAKSIFEITDMVLTSLKLICYLILRYLLRILVINLTE